MYQAFQENDLDVTLSHIENRIKEFDEKIIESDSVYKDAYYFLSLNLKRNEEHKDKKFKVKFIDKKTIVTRIK